MNDRRWPLAFRRARWIGLALAWAAVLAAPTPAQTAAAAGASAAPATAARGQGGTAAIQAPTGPLRTAPPPGGPLYLEDGTIGGPVQLPPLTQGGWFTGPDGGWIARFKPNWTSDPTLEVFLFPPLSGHPTKVERFLVQIPTGPSLPPWNQRALVLGFHPYGLSEYSVFNASGLPQICEQRGWFLVAPYGLDEKNFANLASQQAVDAILGWLRKSLVYDKDRVYTVGFSMGGLNALSYALRHQDPKGIVRIAGVVHHTGTVDAIAQYDLGDFGLKQLMAGPDVFGATPTQQPFAWNRVNPLRVVAGVAQADKAQVANLKDLPIYLHWNAQDINPELVGWNRALRDYLLAQGAAVQVDEVNAGAVHKWQTLSMATAIDFVDDAVAPAPGDLGGGTAELFVDRVATYRCTDVRQIEPATVGRYRLSLSSAGGNSLAVQGARGVRRLGIDLPVLPLSTLAPLTLTSWTTDGKPLTLVLAGYALPPSHVLVDGVPTAVVHDAATGELSITPNASGAFAVVDVLP